MILQSHSWAYIQRKLLIQKDPYTPTFIATLFMIAKTWKKHKCPSTEEWIKKMWYIYTMEYYSAIKKRNSAICGNMMDLESVILSEVKSNREREISMTSIICGI